MVGFLLRPRDGRIVLQARAGAVRRAGDRGHEVLGEARRHPLVILEAGLQEAQGAVGSRPERHGLFVREPALLAIEQLVVGNL